MIRPGDVIGLSIDRPAVGGRMIARHDGRVVLVGGAIPGERARVRISRVTRGVAYGDVVAVEAPSPDRRAWEGDPACGGCLYGHIDYARQLAVKSAVVADAFARIGRLPLTERAPVMASPERGYRMRARVHVRGAAWGFFREATHDLCDARRTGQLLPSTCDALDALSAEAASLGLAGPHQIEIAENADASNRVAYLHVPRAVPETTLERLAGDGAFTGVAAAGVARGSVYVTDTLQAGSRPVRLRRHVQAFFQGNRFLLQPLVQHVVDRVDADGDILDLYAGGGLFSVAIATAHSVGVTAVEGDRTAAADLAVNAAASNGITPVHQGVEAYLSSAAGRQTAATIVVDPPRTGMSKEATDGIVGAVPRRIVYVSCDVATLARDARRFVDAGYTMSRVDAFDMFPNTPHVEVVAVLDR